MEKGEVLKGSVSFWQEDNEKLQRGGSLGLQKAKMGGYLSTNTMNKGWKNMNKKSMIKNEWVQFN